MNFGVLAKTLHVTMEDADVKKWTKIALKSKAKNPGDGFIQQLYKCDTEGVESEIHRAMTEHRSIHFSFRQQIHEYCLRVFRSTAMRSMGRNHEGFD